MTKNMITQDQIDFIKALRIIRIPSVARISGLSVTHQVVFGIIYELCKNGFSEISNDTLSVLVPYKGIESSSRAVSEMVRVGLISTEIVDGKRIITLNLGI